MMFSVILVKVNQQERNDLTIFLEKEFFLTHLPYLKWRESELITGMSDNNLEFLDQKPFPFLYLVDTRYAVEFTSLILHVA